MESVRLSIFHDVTLCECNNTIMVEENLFKWEIQVIEGGEAIVAIDDTIEYGKGWQGRIQIVMRWLFTQKVKEQGHYSRA
jgi:hypothetical protein